MPRIRCLLLTVTAMCAILFGCAGEPAWDADDATATYKRYQDVDLDYFFDAPPDAPTSEHPLYRGLKAKIDGRLDDAERHLEAATGAVPDSLRPFVYERLRAINERSYDWDDAVRYRTRTDSAFTADSDLGRILAERSVPTVDMTSDTVTVPFDGFRVEGHINGIDRSIAVFLDTGAPGMAVNISKAFVDRYNLPVDTTAAVGRSRVGALNIDHAKYEVQIDSISIGGVTIQDVPATTSYPEGEHSDDEAQGGESGDEDLGVVFLEAGVLRYLFDEIRYNYADSTFTMIRDVPEQEVSPNFAVVSYGWPIVRAEAGGRSMAGLVDTGNGWISRLYASSFPPADYEQLGTRTGTFPEKFGGSDWSVPYYRISVRFPGDLRREEMVIVEKRGTYPFRIDANFGQDLWTEGTLVLDYQNRRAYYEGASTFEETN